MTLILTETLAKSSCCSHTAGSRLDSRCLDIHCLGILASVLRSLDKSILTCLPLCVQS